MNSLLDITCENKPEDIETEHLNSEELGNLTKVVEIVDHKTTLKDERSVSWTPVA